MVKHSNNNCIIDTVIHAMNTINKEKAADYVLSCRNFDGSFGGIPDA